MTSVVEGHRDIQQVEQQGRCSALVLGGGGGLGIAQAAYIQAAAELGFRPSIVVGTSVGSLNGAWVAMHPDDPSGLLDVWRGLHRMKVLHLNPLHLAARLAGRTGGISPNTIVPYLIEHHIGKQCFEQTQVPLAVVATNLSEGCKHVFREGRLDRAILASTAIPGVFDPVKIGGDLFVDGCVTASVDLATAIEMGATEILAIDLTSTPEPGQPRGVYGVLRRSLGILSHATTDAMQAIARRHMPVSVLRPTVGSLSPWRIAVDENDIEASLNEARVKLRAALDADGHVRPTLPAKPTASRRVYESAPIKLKANAKAGHPRLGTGEATAG